MITLKKLLERVKDGKVDPLSKMGKQKLTGREISNYYKDNPDQKKAARDKDVKKGIELALDLSGAQSYAVKELEKFKRGLSKHPAVKKALQHANEQVESSCGAGEEGTDKLRKKYEKDTPMESVTEAVADITVDPKNRINSGQQQGYHGMEIAKQARRMGLKSAVMHKHVRIKGGKKQVNDFLRLVIGKSRYGDPTEKDMTTPQIDKMLNKGMKGKNEMKEGRDLSEFTSLDEGNNIPKIKEIVAKKQATKIQGVMVDMFTASLISQIYDKVSDANKKKMEKMTVARLADAAYKIMKKQSVHEDYAKDLDLAQKNMARLAKKESGQNKKDYMAVARALNQGNLGAVKKVIKGIDTDEIRADILNVLVGYNDLIAKMYPKAVDAKGRLKTPMSVGKMIKEDVNEAIDFFKVAKEFEQYARKHGGIDKKDFLKVGQFVRQLGKESDVNKQDRTFIQMKHFIDKMDTDPRDGVITLFKKNGMVKNNRLVRECADEKDFKPHMMYDPKTGKGVKANTYADHVKYDKMGYTHEKPEVKENKARRDAMRGMSRDKDFMDKDDDDMVASPDDRKAADKNPLIQLRRIADLPKGGDMEFKDGKKKKITQKDAQKALKGFSALRKNPDKLKYQTMVGKSHSDLKRILKLIR